MKAKRRKKKQKPFESFSAVQLIDFAKSYIQFNFKLKKQKKSSLFSNYFSSLIVIRIKINFEFECFKSLFYSNSSKNLPSRSARNIHHKNNLLILIYRHIENCYASLNFTRTYTQHF